MRWMTYFILAYIALGAQIALSGFVDIKGAEPNLVLMVVIFIAINAAREPALLGAFMLGLMQDLLTIQPMGVWAIAYSLVAMFVISTQEVVYRENLITHFVLALVGGMLCAIVLVLHGWIYSLVWKPTQPQVPNAEMITRQRISALGMFTGAIYSAVLAPLILGILQKFKRVFAFRRRV